MLHGTWACTRMHAYTFNFRKKNIQAHELLRDTCRPIAKVFEEANELFSLCRLGSGLIPSLRSWLGQWNVLSFELFHQKGQHSTAHCRKPKLSSYLKRFSFLRNITSWAGTTTRRSSALSSSSLLSASLQPLTSIIIVYYRLVEEAAPPPASQRERVGNRREKSQLLRTWDSICRFHTKLKCVTGLAPRYKGIEKCIISPSMWQPQVKWKFRQYSKRMK